MATNEEARPAGYPATPTLDRMLAVRKQTQPVGEFLEWAESEGYRLGAFDPDGEYTPVWSSTEQLLARWQGIDLNEAERERAAVLDWVRGQHG